MLEISTIILNLLNFANTVNFLLILLTFVFFYHLVFYIIRDKKRLKALKNLKEPKLVKIEDLKYQPLVNIIVPAWKEEKEFKECLISISELKYPKIKVIVNAGGDEETIRIAEEFKSKDNFVILKQIGGKSRAALGKIKALNRCLDYVSEGLLYFIDADCLVTDEILLRIIRPIVNLNENIVTGGMRPLKSQESIDLIQYLTFMRFGASKIKVKRYHDAFGGIAGANMCINYESMKKIGKFTENRFIAEDVSRGLDISELGIKVYCIFDFRSRIYTAYAENFKELYEQRKRYIENSLLFSLKNKRLKYFIKLTGLMLISFYLILFPFFLFFSYSLFFIGLSLILWLYFKKIRMYLLFKNDVEKNFRPKIHKILFIKIILYIYIEAIIAIITLFGIRNYLKFIKREEHLLLNS